MMKSNAPRVQSNLRSNACNVNFSAVHAAKEKGYCGKLFQCVSWIIFKVCYLSSSFDGLVQASSEAPVCCLKIVGVLLPSQ